MNNFKRFLKSFTPYQKWYLIIVVAITALFVIFLPEMMLEDTSNLFVVICSVIAVIANPLCELMISKQSRYNFLVDIFLIEVPELVICWWNGWYTIAIVTIAYWIPVSLISYLRWGKHPDQEETEMTAVKTLSPKQDVLIVAAIFVFAFLVGSLISRIPGASDSFLDALSTGFGMANGILLLLRYREQWYAWLITLVLYAILYIRGGAYIMLITVAAMFVNTCYGYYKWYIYNKTHNEDGTLKTSA